MITTARTVIRPATEDDAPFILELLNDPDFIAFIADRGVRTLDQARAYIRTRLLAAYEQHGWGLFVVEDRTSREPMGLCGLVRRAELDGPDLGYAFLPRYRGRGLALEAAEGVVRWAGESAGITKLQAIVNPENERSVQVLRKLGFGYERPVLIGDKEISLFTKEG